MDRLQVFAVAPLLTGPNLVVEYRSTNKLVLFSLEDLRSFPKSGVVAELAGADWFCRVVFSVDNGIVNAVELHVKDKDGLSRLHQAVNARVQGKLRFCRLRAYNPGAKCSSQQELLDSLRFGGGANHRELPGARR